MLPKGPTGWEIIPSNDRKRRFDDDDVDDDGHDDDVADDDDDDNKMLDGGSRKRCQFASHSFRKLRADWHSRLTNVSPPRPPISMLTGNFFATRQAPQNKDYNIEIGGVRGAWTRTITRHKLWVILTHWQLL